jgi:hypothetical protein
MARNLNFLPRVVIWNILLSRIKLSAKKLPLIPEGTYFQFGPILKTPELNHCPSPFQPKFKKLMDKDLDWFFENRSN